jgi:acyl dehydratase
VSFSGSSTSVRLCPRVNSACDEKNVFTVDNVLKYLANYTYVHVDEMRADQTTCEEDCATVVRDVAAKGMGGRIIFYFRFSPTDTNGLKTQYDLLQTAKEGMLRKIFFEVYKDGWITTSNVANAKSLLKQWDSTYSSVFPGSNLYIAPAIGLSNWATEGAYMNCCSQDMTALSTIYGDMHSIQPDWKGLSFYLASKCDDCWSSGCTVEPVGAGTRVYTRLTVVNKLNGLNSWWDGKGSNTTVTIKDLV